MFRMLISATVLLLASATAMAQWGTVTRITGYYVYAPEGGNAFFTTENNQNPHNCPRSEYLGMATDGNFKAIWAQIIAAHAAGMTVSVKYSMTECVGEYPKVDAIAVPNIW